MDFLAKKLSALHVRFSKITKTARQGKLKPPVELTQFSDKNLCVCHHINVYLERMKIWTENEGRLLVLFKSPH